MAIGAQNSKTQEIDVKILEEILSGGNIYIKFLFLKK